MIDKIAFFVLIAVCVDAASLHSNLASRRFTSLQMMKNIAEIPKFHEFLQEHSREYNSLHEYEFRFYVFVENMKKAKVFQRLERGTAEYGITKFSDLTQSEFQHMLGLRPDLKPKFSAMELAEIPNVELPKEFDWRDQNIVTPVKNQGQCGSCWAFSTTGNVEGQWALKHQKLYSLSEQELVDCDKKDNGCGGGLPENAYEAIKELGGLETESEYPYEAKGDKCEFDKSQVKVRVNGSLEISENEKDMAKWLVQNGPISIGINANAMQFYRGGISHPFSFLCSPKNLDHGVLIVGYGIHEYPLFNLKLPYWIVKNSWGLNWGEQGYYRVYRGDGTCGVNKMATSAVVP